MRQEHALGSVVAITLIAACSVGCMGFVHKRTPRIPRREREVHLDVPPRIDLVFECRENGYPGLFTTQCASQEKALRKIVREFDFLSRAEEGTADYDYRLSVQADIHAYNKIAPVGDEGCGYLMLMLLPCIDKTQLSTTAQLTTPDGSIVGTAESYARLTGFSHLALLWAFPLGLPAIPAMARFSTNTYRNLLPQIGQSLVTYEHARQSTGAASGTMP